MKKNGSIVKGVVALLGAVVVIGGAVCISKIYSLANVNKIKAVNVTKVENVVNIGEEEKRILNGEVVEYKLQEGAISGMLCELDLNLDGIKEIISIEEFRGQRYDAGQLDIKINDCIFTYEGYDVVVGVVALSLDKENILIGIREYGPSDDSQTTFYKYNGKSVQQVGKIANDITEANKINQWTNVEMVTIKDNTIKCAEQRGTISNDVFVLYEWNGEELVDKKQDTYEYVGVNEKLYLVKDLEVYADRDLNSECKIISANVIVHPVKMGHSDDVGNWNYVRGEDGTEGWIRIGYNEYYDIFENLNMYD